MTTPSGTEPTDAELNKMVTEALGFYVHLEGRVPYASKIKEPNFGFRLFNVEPLVSPFSTSRDACATFEATIVLRSVRRTYNMNLEYAVREDVTNWPRLDPEDRFFEVITATPRQRCIAFLRMKGVL